ncbi:MAG: thymidylate kinase [Candidatus Methanomethylophilaceae archaeon]|jgi:dTMP kinase|nr:thymidylate kinase [Candidatus Methanomethylophilaceae archaeon]
MTWYAVDGMDGSGKTTSSDLIRERLEARGRKVLEITHPNESCIFGRLASKALCMRGKFAEKLSTLLYIIDVLHSLDVKRWRGKGYDDVIFVRYSMAAAYLPESLCVKAYEIIEKILPVPDVKVFVDIEPKVAMERILARGEELELFETEEKLEATRRKMHSIAGSWHVIDNSGTLENTVAQTEAFLDSLWGEE